MDKYYSEFPDIKTVDYNDPELFDTVGIDMQTDYYDFLHFNIKGARKFSSVLSGYISENINITPADTDTELWISRCGYADSLADE